MSWSLASYTASVRFPIGNDAIGYMRGATNFLKGEGIKGIVNETESPDLDFAPTPYHPPGFSLAIAGVSALGLSVEQAALAISRLAWALLPLALLFAFRPLLSMGWATAVTVLVLLSPSLYLFGSVINSDVPTLLLVVLATGLIIRGVGELPRFGLLMSAGFILGLAYALRNSVTAVYVGLLAAFAASYLLRLMPMSSAVKSYTWILLGTVPVVGLLLIRNHLVFGELQPYVLMVGEHASLVESFRVYLHGLFWDLTGSPDLARQLAWDFKTLVVAAVPVVGLLGWAAVRYWRASDSAGRFALLFGLLFSGAGGAMLVIAHTYHGLDFGYLLRHMMQYAWILLAILILLLLAIGARRASLFAGVVVASLLASRIFFIASDIRAEREVQEAFARHENVVEAAQAFISSGRLLTDQIKQRLTTDPAIPAAVRGLPPHALILSNQGQLLSYLSGRPVRTLPLPSISDLSTVQSRVSQVFREMKSDRPVYVVFVPDNRIVRMPDAKGWQAVIADRLRADFRVVGAETNVLVMQASKPTGSGRAGS
jgi:hypothetical protein